MGLTAREEEIRPPGLGRRLWASLRRWTLGRRGAAAVDGAGGAESRLIHDLRTPLTSIRSFSEILRHHPELSHRQRARYLDIILSEGRRLEHVIEDFEAQTGPDPAR